MKAEVFSLHQNTSSEKSNVFFDINRISPNITNPSIKISSALDPIKRLLNSQRTQNSDEFGSFSPRTSPHFKSNSNEFSEETTSASLPEDASILNHRNSSDKDNGNVDASIIKNLPPPPSAFDDAGKLVNNMIDISSHNEKPTLTKAVDNVKDAFRRLSIFETT